MCLYLKYSLYSGMVLRGTENLKVLTECLSTAFKSLVSPAQSKA